jgi:hypothetical protein
MIPKSVERFSEKDHAQIRIPLPAVSLRARNGARDAASGVSPPEAAHLFAP